MARMLVRPAGKRVLPLLGIALAVVAAGAVGIAHAQRATLAAVNPGPGFPAHYFAPYIDTSAGLSITTISQQSGIKFYTLAFMLSGGGCQASWNGSTPVNQGFMAGDINSFRASGGDVSVSFGGAAG